MCVFIARDERRSDVEREIERERDRDVKTPGAFSCGEFARAQISRRSEGNVVNGLILRSSRGMLVETWCGCCRRGRTHAMRLYAQNEHEQRIIQDRLSAFGKVRARVNTRNNLEKEEQTESCKRVLSYLLQFSSHFHVTSLRSIIKIHELLLH